VKSIIQFVCCFAILLGAFAKADPLSDFLMSAGKNLGPKPAQMFALDILFLKSMKGKRASLLSDRIFGTKGELDGEIFLQFFLNRISSVKLADCGFGGLALACVDYGVPVMKVTPAFYTYSQMSRVALLLHESVHAEPSGNPHAPCPAPMLNGMQACANNVEDPYFVQLVFLKNVMENCDSCSINIKAEARYNFDQFKGRVINPDLLLQLTQDR
jgi:hypothetical protein